MRLDLCAFGRRLVVDYDRAEEWADDEAATSPIGNTACDFELADEGEPFGFTSTHR